ncbi:DUF6789 family protein [uncultured Kriegella sp.]|uniref:DUF6789 family protein n=1 Tax=uncultured Kriegella sp. TaxID=1798910 RepID=UPI0030D97824|tara:strand:+ start:20913 stop:21362 length:450 start_codon:yes stop_codon:yes gene_type:complete
MGSTAIYAILLAGILATTTMTLFSYLVSQIRNREFNEAQLLNKFIDNTKCLPEIPNENSLWGWFLHYGIGIFFTVWMYCLFITFEWQPSIWLGAVLGLIAGMVGAVGWLSLFAFHPNAPETDLKEFLIQLLMAHCIFGATVATILAEFI